MEGDLLQLTPNVVKILAALLTALSIGSAARLWTIYRGRGAASADNRLRSLWTWWALFALFCGALCLGGWGIAAFIGVASGLGIREYDSMVLRGSPSRRWLPLVYLARWQPLSWRLPSAVLCESAGLARDPKLATTN
jgi:predicted CDP-diglyceride synthetase/phosphatidate cytidylyltransferase